MLNIFKRPVEKATIEAWAKIMDDFFKVAVLTIPVIIYGKESSSFKVLNVVSLLIIIYGLIVFGRFCRRVLEEKI
ncbi:hypothetical protein BMT54_09620 [Pasteurellaceae bacterium 15-036681]|nr:hypothetical protein BMT54_09620 [Pasteurellaceae bacterium 15-036681]